MLQMVRGSADAVLGLDGAAAPEAAYPPRLVERVMREAARLEAAAKELQRVASGGRAKRR
jgi:hypothetical protein